MTLELHYPANWAFEGEVEVLHLEGKGETSYGRQRLGLKSCHTQPAQTAATRHQQLTAAPPWPLGAQHRRASSDAWRSRAEGRRLLPRLSQGETMSRKTYPSHRWVVREAASRGLLMIVVAKRQTGAAQSQSVTIEPQCVSIISDGGLDPLKVAVLVDKNAEAQGHALVQTRHGSGLPP